MARVRNNIALAQSKHYQARLGPLGAGGKLLIDGDYDNDDVLSWSDASNLTSLEGIRIDTDGIVRVDQSAIKGARETMTFPLAANASLTTQAFFIAKRAMVITGIQCYFDVADGATNTGYVTKESSTTAAGSGSTVMVGTFDLNATARTTRSATLLSVKGDGQPAAGIVLAAGDRLSFVIASAVTSLAGLVVTVAAAPGNKEDFAVYAMKANGSIATQSFGLALRDKTVTGISVMWGVKATNGGAVTVDVTKDAGTDAPGAGTSILAAALSVKGAINTVNTPALSGTASVLSMVAGNRLSVKFTGTLTALADFILIVYFAPTYSEVAKIFTIKANGSQATQAFWIADRDYLVLEAAEVHSTAGSDGSGVTLDVYIDKGVVTPGGGATCLASTFNLKSTANTVQYANPTTARHTRLLSRGDRLSVVYAGVLTALVGVTAAVVLQPI